MDRNKQIVVNLIGGPGCGKSTAMSGIFFALKKLGYNVEMAPEWVKDKVYEESFHTMDNQIYIFGKQLHKLWRLSGKVDIIITDGCLLNTIIYDKSKSQNLRNLTLEEFNKFENVNFLIKRKQDYKTDGRIETKEEAETLDSAYVNLMNDEGISYHEVPNIDACDVIVAHLISNKII